MNELTLVKSANFGDVQCDFYKDNQGYWLTREQVGAALEYLEPRKAISDIHSRHKERMDQFSTVRKVRTVDGKLREVTIYSRRGVMEICRWSQQPKADAFMDWVWDILESVMNGEAEIVSKEPPAAKFPKLPAAPRLPAINNAVKTLTPILKGAGMSPAYIALVAKSFYAKGGYDFPVDGITVDKQTFSVTVIAEKLGVYSAAGKPHIQAVAAIISNLDINDDEKELVPFQNQSSRHSGPTTQYTQSVIDKVTVWLDKAGWPAPIRLNGKKFGVVYKVTV